MALFWKRIAVKLFLMLRCVTVSRLNMLDKAWGLEPESRLSCQARVTDEDLVVEIPRYTINHAREH